MKRYASIQNVHFRNKETHKIEPSKFSREEFDALSDIEWRCHEKIDGTNIRILWDGETMEVRGRSDNAQLHGGLLVTLGNIFNEEVLEDAFPDLEPGCIICIYGEGYGAGIQKGGGYMKDGQGQGFVCFDIKIGRWWLTARSVNELCLKMGVQRVPFLGSGDLWDAINFGKQKFESALGDTAAEGVVARPVVDLFMRNGDRVICKIKHKDYA